MVLPLDDLLQAGVDVHADALGEIGRAGGEHLVEGSVGLLVFALLHQAEGGFVEGEGVGAGLVAGWRGDSGEGARAFCGDRGGCLHGLYDVPVFLLRKPFRGDDAFRIHTLSAGLIPVLYAYAARRSTRSWERGLGSRGFGWGLLRGGLSRFRE